MPDLRPRICIECAPTAGGFDYKVLIRQEGKGDIDLDHGTARGDFEAAVNEGLRAAKKRPYLLPEPAKVQ